MTSEEMAEAMRRGLDLDHPLDGGSTNQSAQFQSGGHKGGGGGHVAQSQGLPHHQEDDRRRGVNRNSYNEPEPEAQSYQQTGRRESVQVCQYFNFYFLSMMWFESSNLTMITA